MRKHHFILIPIFLGAVSCNISTRKERNLLPKNIQKPNIVYILADDMGYGDLSSLNANSGIETPHMDAVVRNGIYFTEAHSNSSVCTPTRYGILTGRNAWKSRLKNGVLWGYDPPLIEEDRTTVASFLKSNGYHTACIGKWHLGLDWTPKNSEKPIKTVQKRRVLAEGDDSNVDFTKPASGPKTLGFDYSYIIPASLDMAPYVYLENDIPTAVPTAYTKGKNQKNDGRGVFWRAGEMDPDFDFDNVLGHFTEKAKSYIQEQSDVDTPFFLYFPLTAPHTPWLPTESVIGSTNAGRYGDFVRLVDNTVGQVVAALKASGQLENTLVIVTSDNGSNWTRKDKEQYDHRANHIYRGQKADIYEGGHHIPYIAQWPSVIEKGSVSDQKISTTDLIGTVAGIIDQPLPEGAGEDSYDLWPAYIGEDTADIRDHIIHHSFQGYFSIRKGKWKLTPHLGSGGFTKPKSGNPEKEGFEGTLYNMEEDPTESNNLYNEEIEVREALLAILNKEKAGHEALVE